MKAGRRTLLQLVSIGWLMPWQAWAAMRRKSVFEATEVDVVRQVLQVSDAHLSKEIEIVAPKSVVQGQAVQVEVISRIAGTEAIAIFAEKNPVPLVANFTFSRGARPYIITRIRLAESQRVEVAVKAAGQYYQASHDITVTQDGVG